MHRLYYNFDTIKENTTQTEKWTSNSKMDTVG